MPVPVPRTTKAQAHSVIKPLLRARGLSLPNNSLTTLPEGPHPSFDLDEEWATALPSWRRSQQRPLADQVANMQDFHQGLAGADNAPVSKGFGAQAPLSPLYHPFHQAHSTYSRDTHTKSEAMMQQAFSDKDQAQFDSNMRWDVDFLVGPEAADAAPQDRMHHTTSPMQVVTDSESDNNRFYSSNGCHPIYEDQSPGSASGPDNDSSPLEPITPFGAFVDRAVADAVPYYLAFCPSQYTERTEVPDYYQGKQAAAETYRAPPVFPTLAEPPQDQEAIADTITSSPTLGYKTLAEPLSEWVAAFVWKACTSGFSLPPAFAQPSINIVSYPAAAPGYLAPSIHSLLLATLLQPSAALLAVWYIVRLPIYLGSAPLGKDEQDFRSLLFADGQAGFDNDTPEGSAAFRLVVLGCMLANKWLDDHTFSNKTWHSISNIPIQTLNNLEALTLKIFSYDLSISSQEWSRWLTHVMSYHLSLSSPAYPQPISRPSSNPHSIVRRVIDEVIKVPSTFKAGSSLPQPVFIGLEDRLRERMERESAMDALEIDLDEDGPLREEYLPKRRASKLASQHETHHGSGLSQGQTSGTGHWGIQDAPASKGLPPPAKWSPAGDEPILRDRNRVSGQYVAVQAPSHLLQQYPASYHPHDVTYNNQNWNPAGAYMPVKAQSVYVHDVQSMFHMNPNVYNPFSQISALVIPHARSHSLSYDQETSRNHMRSYSQSRFDYKNSDLRMMPNEHNPFQDMSSKWMDRSASFLPHSQAYIHIPSVAMQPTW